MDNTNPKPQSNGESKHQANNKNKKLIAWNDKDKTNPEEIRNNYDLVVARVTSRLQQHAVNINFLQNIIGMPHVLTLLIVEYISFYDQGIVKHGLIYSPGQPSLLPSMGLFKVNENSIPEYVQAEMQAKAIAHDHVLTAGPLDKLEQEVRKNPNAVLQPLRITMTLDGVVFTLKGSLLQLAIMNLDQTIHSAEDSTGPKSVDVGQAERLLDLIEKLMSGRMPEAREQARSAAPVEDEKPSRAKEEERSNVLKAAFNQIKVNNFDTAGKIIMAYIINTKPAVITDNRYFLNLLKLIPMAFSLLLARAKELKDGLYGEQADQYCFKIIGI